MKNDRGQFLLLITKQILNAKSVLTKIIQVYVHMISFLRKWDRNMMLMLKILTSPYATVQLEIIKLVLLSLPSQHLYFFVYLTDFLLQSTKVLINSKTNVSS